MNIFNKTDFRRYFIHDNVLRTIVSIVTGIFIVYFNAFGGMLLVEMLYESSFGYLGLDILKYLIVIPFGLVLGYILLKFIINITFRLFKTDGMEEYSLLRFLLLFSVFVYLIILAMYFTFYLLNTDL